MGAGTGKVGDRIGSTVRKMKVKPFAVQNNIP